MSSQQASATSLLGDCSRVLIESPAVKLAPNRQCHVHTQAVGKCRHRRLTSVRESPSEDHVIVRSHFRELPSVLVRPTWSPYHEAERALCSHRCRLSTPVDNCVETQFRWHIRTLRGPPTDPGLGRHSDVRTTTLSDDVAARVRIDARIHASDTARDHCSTTEGPT